MKEDIYGLEFEIGLYYTVIEDLILYDRYDEAIDIIENELLPKIESFYKKYPNVFFKHYIRSLSKIIYIATLKDDMLLAKKSLNILEDFLLGLYRKGKIELFKKSFNKAIHTLNDERIQFYEDIQDDDKKVYECGQFIVNLIVKLLFDFFDYFDFQKYDDIRYFINQMEDLVLFKKFMNNGQQKKIEQIVNQVKDILIKRYGKTYWDELESYFQEIGVFEKKTQEIISDEILRLYEKLI